MKKEKQKLRKNKLKTLRSFSPEEKNKQDRKIYNKVIKHPAVKKSDNIMVYISTEEEVDTRKLLGFFINRKDKVYVPVTEEDRIKVAEIDKNTRLERGKYGILEPAGNNVKFVSPSILDIIIVPGVAFSKKGGRLGRGKAYYDRFLKKVNDETTVIGLCYNSLMCESIPEEEHDVRVDEVITG